MDSEPRHPSISSNAPNRWEKKRILPDEEKNFWRGSSHIPRPFENGDYP